MIPLLSNIISLSEYDCTTMVNVSWLSKYDIAWPLHMLCGYRNMIMVITHITWPSQMWCGYQNMCMIIATGYVVIRIWLCGYHKCYVAVRIWLHDHHKSYVAIGIWLYGHHKRYMVRNLANQETRSTHTSQAGNRAFSNVSMSLGYNIITDYLTYYLKLQRIINHY